MKKIMLLTLVLSTIVFGFGGGSKPKYSNVSKKKVIKVYNGLSGCRKYIYINMYVKGKKRNSKSYKDGYATTWLKFGDRKRQCGGRANANRITVGQVSNSNSRYYSSVRNSYNSSSCSAMFFNGASSKGRGHKARFTTYVKNRTFDYRLTAR